MGYVLYRALELLTCTWSVIPKRSKGVPCVGVSVDNTSVNLGKRNSIMTRAVSQNLAILTSWAVLVT